MDVPIMFTCQIFRWTRTDHPMPSMELKTDGWGSVTHPSGGQAVHFHLTVYKGQRAVSVSALHQQNGPVICLINGDQWRDPCSASGSTGSVNGALRYKYIAYNYTVYSYSIRLFFTGVMGNFQPIIFIAKYTIRFSRNFYLNYIESGGGDLKDILAYGGNTTN